jgi:type II secretory pathway pseudopilin PulG
MTVALRNRKGFGLIESLITLGVLIIVLGSVYSLLTFNQKTASVQDQVLGLNQTIIAATELIGREARQAGLKVACQSDGKLGPVAQMFSSGFLPDSTAPVIVTLNIADYPIKITQGTGSAPDAVTILGALGDKTYPTQLANDPAIGDTAITLNLSAAQTQARYSVGDVVYIGEEVENARITGISGNQLTINPALTKDHAPWAEVGKLSVISYEIFNVNGIKRLMRKENAGSFEAVAEDAVVVDLQATQNGNRPTIDSLKVQTANPDANYQSNGGYRQKTFAIHLAPMNM